MLESHQNTQLSQEAHKNETDLDEEAFIHTSRMSSIAFYKITGLSYVAFTITHYIIMLHIFQKM